MGRKIEFSKIRQLRFALLVCFTACGVFEADFLLAQQSRRNVLTKPELVLDSNAPQSVTHILKFTNGGRTLLAAGSDKIVRLWPYHDGMCDVSETRKIRWNRYREERGNIYCAAMTTDEKYLAIGGHGITARGLLSVVQMTDQEVVATINTEDKTILTAINFCDSNSKIVVGSYSGAVYLCDRHTNTIRRIGTHQRPDNKLNTIADIFKVSETLIVTVSVNGTVKIWDLSRQPRETKRFQFSLDKIRDVAFNPKTNILIATGAYGNQAAIEFRKSNGSLVRQTRFEKNSFADKIAISMQGDVVAFSQVTLKSSSAKLAWNSKVLIYDISSHSTSKELARQPHIIDSIALHPNKRTVALTGGDNYEVQLWNMNSGKLQTKLESDGKTIWEVALSKDGKSFGIKCERSNSNWERRFNQVGAGEFKVFNLESRTGFLPDQNFDAIRPVEQLNGWKLQPAADANSWKVISPTGRRFKLPWDNAADVDPNCFTFLKPIDGLPTRLAVGHRFGTSIFDLIETGPVRTRLCVGHSDEVTSICPSFDHRMLISGSRDQTISLFSLNSWKNQRELGTSFEIKEGSLYVSKVEPGSPGWEAGLTVGDKITLFAYDTKVGDGGPTAWMQRLRNPVPGKECFFQVQREGNEKAIRMLTTVRQRPVWRMFVDRRNEWVLWRWHDYFYDCSTEGDTLIGWHFNVGLDRTPRFALAEQSREKYHRPAKIDELINKSINNPERINGISLVPPKVDLEIVRKGESYEAIVSLSSEDEVSLTGEPSELSIWIGDHRIGRWKNPRAPYRQKVQFKHSELRAGSNPIIARAYSQGGVRGDSDAEFLTGPPSKTRRLFVLTVGANDYSNVGSLGNLNYAIRDATAFRLVMEKQSGYDSVEVFPLLQQNATRQQVVNRLAEFTNLQPNDQLVVYFAGHGTFATPDDPTSLTLVTVDARSKQLGKTALPVYRGGNNGSDGLSAFTMFDALAALKCRKLIVTDACHSGGAAQVIRMLTPDFKVGPTVIVAAKGNQSALESTYELHGVFTYSLLEALTEQFDATDKNRDSWVSAEEMFEYSSTCVPRLVKKLENLGVSVRQNPTFWAPSMDKSRPLFVRAGKAVPFVD